VFRVIWCFIPCTAVNKAFLILLLWLFVYTPSSFVLSFPKAKECRQETGRVFLWRSKSTLNCLKENTKNCYASLYLAQRWNNEDNIICSIYYIKFTFGKYPLQIEISFCVTTYRAIWILITHIKPVIVEKGREETK
jgi:hypothetical protein